MSFVLSLLATVLLGCWLGLLMLGTQEELDALHPLDLYRLDREIEEKKNKLEAEEEKLSSAKGWEKAFRKLLFSEKSELKKIVALMKKKQKLETRRPVTIILLLPGMSVLRLFKIDATMPFYKNLIEQFSVVGDRKYAGLEAKKLIATMISAVVGGMGAAFCLSALLASTGDTQKALVVVLVGLITIFLLAYIPIDNLKQSVTVRSEVIARTYPDIVSKLALLMGAGIDSSRAWQMTAESGSTVLYTEMRRVTSEINLGMSAAEAYDHFVRRCRSPLTSKLASALLQEKRKGNDEIAVLLQELARESWEERRQSAKRSGELAQSKLLLPMMLMFGGILLLVLAPMVTGFSSMGF